MSAVASFFVLNRHELPALIEAANSDGPNSAHALLDERARNLGELYDWSGNLFVFVLEFLHEREIYTGTDYEEIEHALNPIAGVGVYVLSAPLMTSIEQLDPGLYPDEDLREYFDSIGMDFEEAGHAGKDGIRVLSEQLALLSEDEVLLVTID